MLWAKYGREHEWQDGVESVVVRPPLMEVFKDRTSVEAVLFIHRWVGCLFFCGHFLPRVTAHPALNHHAFSPFPHCQPPPHRLCAEPRLPS